MNVFDRYPLGGRALLGRPKAGSGSCRSGYGLGLQRLTGHTVCAYCGVNLVDDFSRWLLMSVDHVVPRGEAIRLGISPGFYEDAINLVLCCSGCNGFGNRYRWLGEPQTIWEIAEFTALRDRVFEDRTQRIATRRASALRFFETRPWDRPATEMHAAPSVHASVR